MESDRAANKVPFILNSPWTPRDRLIRTSEGFTEKNFLPKTFHWKLFNANGLVPNKKLTDQKAAK